MALFDSQAALSHFSRNRRSHSRNFPQQREFLPQTNFHLLLVFVCHIIGVLRQNYVFKHQGGQKREVSPPITKTRSALLNCFFILRPLPRQKKNLNSNSQSKFSQFISSRAQPMSPNVISYSYSQASVEEFPGVS